MFAIYNNGSVGFRNTVDNLYSLKKLDSPNNARMNPDDDSLFQDYTKHEKEKKDETSDDNRINAYKKVANIHNSEKVYHVSEIMTKECVTLESNVSLEEAYTNLRENHVNQIPILSLDRKIIGMLNKKIILNMIVDHIDNAKTILDRKIDDIYLPELITTDPLTDIRRVAKVMIDLKLDAVPVVDSGDYLLGIVSKSDIIKAVATIPKFELWY